MLRPKTLLTLAASALLAGTVLPSAAATSWPVYVLCDETRDYYGTQTECWARAAGGSFCWHYYEAEGSAGNTVESCYLDIEPAEARMCAWDRYGYEGSDTYHEECYMTQTEQGVCVFYERETWNGKTTSESCETYIPLMVSLCTVGTIVAQFQKSGEVMWACDLSSSYSL